MVRNKTKNMYIKLHPSRIQFIYIHILVASQRKTKRKISLLKTDNASHPNDIMMKNWIRIVPKTFTNNIQPKFLSRSGQMVHSIFICYTYIPASRYRIGFDMCFWYNISCMKMDKWFHFFIWSNLRIYCFVLCFPMYLSGPSIFSVECSQLMVDRNVTTHDTRL